MCPGAQDDAQCVVTPPASNSTPPHYCPVINGTPVCASDADLGLTGAGGTFVAGVYIPRLQYRDLHPGHRSGSRRPGSLHRGLHSRHRQRGLGGQPPDRLGRQHRGRLRPGTVAADRRLPRLSRSEGPSWRTPAGSATPTRRPTRGDGQMTGTRPRPLATPKDAPRSRLTHTGITRDANRRRPQMNINHLGIAAVRRRARATIGSARRARLFSERRASGNATTAPLAAVESWPQVRAARPRSPYRGPTPIPQPG